MYIFIPIYSCELCILFKCDACVATGSCLTTEFVAGIPFPTTRRCLEILAFFFKSIIYVSNVYTLSCVCVCIRLCLCSYTGSSGSGFLFWGLGSAYGSVRAYWLAHKFCILTRRVVGTTFCCPTPAGSLAVSLPLFFIAATFHKIYFTCVPIACVVQSKQAAVAVVVLAKLNFA